NLINTVEDKAFVQAMKDLNEILVWPGKPGVQPEAPVRPLTKPEQERFAAGKQLYDLTCGNCHRPHGFGMPGLAPPLANSEWIGASDKRLARIVLHGMTGPVMVLGKRYNMNMPGHQSFSDQQVANVLTYIRREWDHPYDPVTPETVSKVRAATKGHEHGWTAAELLEIK
ncbi:MAG: c-type cytochrome, partial [Limisphaerales bacterium]